MSYQNTALLVAPGGAVFVKPEQRSSSASRRLVSPTSPALSPTSGRAATIDSRRDVGDCLGTLTTHDLTLGYVIETHQRSRSLISLSTRYASEVT